MADRAFSTLVPRLLASAPGCPNATALQYIRDSAIRTCERTLVWRYQQPVFNLTPGVYTYNFNKPFNARVHAILRVLMNDTPLEVLTLDEALDRYPQWADKTTDPAVIAETGTEPRSLTQLSSSQYVVLPLPDAAKTYSMRMFYALAPLGSSDGMDSAVFDDLEEVILHGALQHLLVLPGQAWSDRELAAYHAKQYTYQIAERRARANLGNARGMVRAKMQPFGV